MASLVFVVTSWASEPVIEVDRVTVPRIGDRADGREPQGSWNLQRRSICVGRSTMTSSALAAAVQRARDRQQLQLGAAGAAGHGKHLRSRRVSQRAAIASRSVRSRLSPAASPRDPTRSRTQHNDVGHSATPLRCQVHLPDRAAATSPTGCRRGSANFTDAPAAAASATRGRRSGSHPRRASRADRASPAIDDRRRLHVALR